MPKRLKDKTLPPNETTFTESEVLAMLKRFVHTNNIAVYEMGVSKYPSGHKIVRFEASFKVEPDP